MKEIGVAFLVAAPLLVAAAAESPRPRGVAPDFAKFYKSKDSFTCISNPSITIPFSQVNDDYCDCPDGSDEPGTAACSYVHPYTAKLRSDLKPGTVNQTHALPGFYCKNKGHQPSYIPFTRVNDGVCDYELCCDGSEEFAGVGGIKCPDKCKEIGKEWRAKDEIRQKTLTAAGKRRKELKTESDKLRKQVEDKIADMKIQVEAAEVAVSEAEKTFEETEKREKARLARSGGKAGKVAQLVTLAKQRVDELRKSLEDVRKERDDQTSRLKELETILETFKVEYNPNFNDEGVKRAVRSWEDYAAKGRSTVGDNEAHERDLDEIAKEDSGASGVNWAEYEVEDEDDLDQIVGLAAYLPPSLRVWLDGQVQGFKDFLISNGVIAKKSDDQNHAESPAVTQARNDVNNAKNTLSGKRRNLEDSENDLVKDYGPDGIFRALKGQTSSRDSGEYTYEVVWMERTNQKSKKNGGITNMGNFVRFETVIVDDEIPADGKGLGSGERLAMKYDNGQHCWNGPNRQTTVILACSENEEVWKIAEEEKCIYRMEVGTAAVCGIDVGKVVEQQSIKDEL